MQGTYQQPYIFYSNIIWNTGAANAPRPFQQAPAAIQYALDEMVQPVPEVEADCK